MRDELPLRWVKSGPAGVFRGEAQRNEFYVFQIGIWAARTNLLGLDVEFKGLITPWLNCFNTGGTNWDGKHFCKTKDFQPAKTWRADESITAQPKCGRLIYMAQ
jgi:hypothetical protein